MSTVLRFSFNEASLKDEIESDIALAIFTAECVYGRPRVRMEARYVVDEDGATCVLGVDGEAGEAAARVFTGLTSARVGERSFSVRRLQESDGA
jgi:hypothetical protein